MSQPHKKKARESKKGGTNTDLTKSKTSTSTSTRSTEDKSKISEKGQSSKAMSSSSKSSEKPGSAATHKSTDSCKSKTATASSAVSTGAPGVKQQPAQSTAPRQSKMGQKASKLDTKESHAGTLPEKITDTSFHKNYDSKIQKTKQLYRTDADNGNNLPFKEDLLQKQLADVKKIIKDMKIQIVNEVTHTIEEQINILKATIVQSLEIASIELKKTVNAPLKNVSEIEDGKPVLSTMEKLMEPLPTQTPDAPVPKCTGPPLKDKDAFDLLAETLPSEDPDNSAPKYTGPEVEESDVTKTKGHRVGEREDTIPPDYRFKEQPDPKDKGKPLPSSTGPGDKPKTTEKIMSEGDILESLSADFAQDSGPAISKSSVTSSYSAAPPSTLEKVPLQASTAASVSTSQTGAKDRDAFDLLAETLPSEAPDISAPKYTGPPVKESDATKKQIERVGEREDTIPRDYRFKEQPDSKDKGQLAASTGPGAKPKTMAEDDVLECLSADFVQSSSATISKCPPIVSDSAVPPSLQQQAPLQASTAASVSASQPSTKDKDAFDLLAETLPSEAPDDTAPKYTGPEVKESNVDKKKVERVGERDDTLPSDYIFIEKPGPQDKLAPSTDTKEKPKTMTEHDVLDSLSKDFDQTPPAPISKCSAATSHAPVPPSKQKEDKLAPSTDTKDKPKTMTEHDVLDSLSKDFVQASPAPISKCSAATSYAPVPPSKQKEGKDAFDLLAETLPSTAPDDSTPKYTGPAVKELDVTKKKGEREGEHEHTIPPDYRFTEQPDAKDKSKCPLSITTPPAKQKVMSESDVLESLSADFDKSSAAPITKCSFTTAEFSEPPSLQKKDPLLKASTATSVCASQGGPKDPLLKASTATSVCASQGGPKDPPLKASTAASVSASQGVPKDPPLKASTATSVCASQGGPKEKGALDKLAETLPSEAPDNSAPKYAGPAVKESNSSKKAELVGETEESIPPDYRFTEPADPKDKGKTKPVSSTSSGTKPKTMAEDDVLECLSADFVQSSSATISKCPPVVSDSAVPPSLQQQAPLQPSKAASVSASKRDTKDKDAFDLLADTLPSEAPDDTAPKYTGPPVKESDVSKKKGERVGETEGSIPPDYRFTEQADPKDKSKLASSSAGPGAKPKLMTNDEVVDSLSSDFSPSSASHSVTQISKQKETKENSAAKSVTKKAHKR
ncbi:calpastatin isoform X5 [Narcine bancroftii]|uniref:calpastatin isoform X5 n=1 Tax=Narcine bancroftii TaxID=1343680 RepID=UPI003831DAC5